MPIAVSRYHCNNATALTINVAVGHSEQRAVEITRNQVLAIPLFFQAQTLQVCWILILQSRAKLLTCSCSNPQYTLDVPKYSLDVSSGIAYTSKESRTVSLDSQPYRHVDHIEFEHSSMVEQFIQVRSEKLFRGTMSNSFSVLAWDW